ncbi:hypothetical protein [Streptomyces sp. NPDC058955]|uniref:hypothetical protein n=1 Tax=unclassified Streptomyces TaxID=2593676 RepID=UPI00365F96AA
MGSAIAGGIDPWNDSPLVLGNNLPHALPASHHALTVSERWLAFIPAISSAEPNRTNQ